MCLLVPFVSDNVVADSRFLPLAGIEPGMKGHGYTVVSGTKIEPFSVEVVGLLKGQGSVGHLILVKVSGRVLQRSGGIAAGMSGSPVYFQGRLAGAIGYGFENADPSYGLVTPIEEMLKLWDDSLTGQNEVFAFYKGGLSGYKGVAFKRGDSGEETWLFAKPVVTPLLITGLGRRAYNFLSPLFPGDVVFPVFSAAGEAPKEDDGENLAPGSAISVSLVDGDYQVMALGTLTWIENGRFLAFGHPFFNRGKVEYGFGRAYVHETISSVVFPFKIGTGYPPAGRVTQDRGAGVAGEMGVLPEFVEVSVDVTDVGAKRRSRRSFRVIRDEQLMTGLVLAGVMDAVDGTIDRIGPGTATVRFKVEGETLPPIQRENLFYGPDVAVASLKEIGKLLQLLAENEFMPVNLSKISVEVEISSERRSARLLKAEIPKTEFLPGEKFILTGKLQPYRGSQVEVPVEIQLPEDFTPGKWLLSVHGSGYEVAVKNNKNEDMQEESPETFLETVTSLDQLLSEFTSQPANNDLVVEAYPLHQGGMTEDPEEEFYNQEEKIMENVKCWTAGTEYYLTGEEQLVIRIKDPNAEEDETGEIRNPEGEAGIPEDDAETVTESQEASDTFPPGTI